MIVSIVQALAFVLALAAHHAAAAPACGIDAAGQRDALAALQAQNARDAAVLRQTEQLPGLDDPSATVAADQRALGALTSQARHYVDDLRAKQPQFRAREALALSGAAPAAGDYRGELAAESGARVSAFRQGSAAAAQRAIDDRTAQLRERESTLLFDLEQRDAARKLVLRLRLDDLHLDAASRARVRAQLAALDSSEERKVRAMRAADDATLAAYAATARASESAGDARMAADVSAQTAANVRLRDRAFAAGALAGIRARADAFAATYRFAADDASIAAALDASQAASQRRAASLTSADRSSRAAALAAAAALDGVRAQAAAAPCSAAAQP